MQLVKGFRLTKNATFRLPHGNVVYRLVEVLNVCNHGPIGRRDLNAAQEMADCTGLH